MATLLQQIDVIEVLAHEHRYPWSRHDGLIDRVWYMHMICVVTAALAAAGDDGVREGDDRYVTVGDLIKAKLLDAPGRRAADLHNLTVGGKGPRGGGGRGGGGNGYGDGSGYGGGKPKQHGRVPDRDRDFDGDGYGGGHGKGRKRSRSPNR